MKDILNKEYEIHVQRNKENKNRRQEQEDLKGLDVSYIYFQGKYFSLYHKKEQERT